MTAKQAFQPNWTSRPGATILRLLHNNGVSIRELANQLAITEPQLRNLLSGRSAIKPFLASKLAATLGGTPAFWLARDQQYRNDIAQRDLTHPPLFEKTWLRTLPLRDMKKFGWIDSRSTASSQVRECLRFFDVGQIDVWKHHYADTIANTAFRKSDHFSSNLGAVASWFRQAELEAETIRCGPWNPSLFTDTLPRLRSLTWKKNPAIFLPKLREACAECGVAFALVPLPKGCTASGATWFATSSKATLILSARYLSDDHFWFTFFHEAGHLLIHNADGPIIEEPEITSTEMEEQANNFASHILVPEEYREELFSLNSSPKRIFDFSKRIGVSPGPIVGQLQHYGQLAKNQLNHLKRRFVWNISNGSANLEMA